MQEYFCLIVGGYEDNGLKHVSAEKVVGELLKYPSEEVIEAAVLGWKAEYARVEKRYVIRRGIHE